MVEENVLHYLSADNAETITDWASDLKPLIERNPRLSQVDIVFEGGVGTNRTMVHIMRKLFPYALYVGIDVAEGLSQDGRLSESIDKETLQRILDINCHPNMFMEKAMVKANCFDFDLIRDIAEKTGRSVPLLVTYNALYSLMHETERTPFENKQSKREIVTIEGLTSLENPFIAQIHVISIDNSRVAQIHEVLSEKLEITAQRAGWKTDRVDIGLLLLRNT